MISDTWSSWLALGGWLGSALVIVSLMQARVLRFRVLNLLGAVLATVYNTVLAIWPFAAMNAVIAVIDAYWLIRLQRERDAEGTYVIVRVSPQDSLLRHLLGVHLRDIRTFQPGFAPEGLGTEHEVFVVMRADEAVGVVAVVRTSPGRARIDLDFVTRRYRDYSPGEFVYRRSGVLAAAGIGEVWAAAPVKAQREYYARLGFRAEGTTWALTVDPGSQGRGQPNSGS